MKKRFQPTDAQRQAAEERRARFRALSASIAKMTDDEISAKFGQMGLILKADGTPLSPHNARLVYSQRESASMVAGFDQWRLYGRRVKKGGSGILIWAPGGGGKKESDLQAAAEPSNFFPVYVYDIGDTEDIDPAHPFERPEINQAGAVITPGLRQEWAKTEEWLKENAPERAQVERITPAPAPETPKVNEALVARLRALADGMQKTIDEKINNTYSGGWTRRKQAISDSVRRDGYNLEKRQAALRALADAHEAGTVPLSLSRVKSKAEVDRLIINGDKDLLALIEGRTPDRAKEQELRALEAEVKGLIGVIDDFFPTPREIGEEMAMIASIGPGMTVLEPQAGAGALAKVAADTGAEVDCVERAYTLQKFLRAQGYNVIGDDFLEMSPNGKRYDAVIMNPPFSKKAAIDHIRHAVKFLKPGGNLVSVTDAGVFHNSDNKSKDFREWLSLVGGYDRELPPGSFKESGTGVNTRLVIIQNWNPETP